MKTRPAQKGNISAISALDELAWKRLIEASVASGSTSVALLDMAKLGHSPGGVINLDEGDPRSATSSDESPRSTEEVSRRTTACRDEHWKLS